jgi:uncharacterized FlaG/YvyC family protein
MEISNISTVISSSGNDVKKLQNSGEIFEPLKEDKVEPVVLRADLTKAKEIDLVSLEHTQVDFSQGEVGEALSQVSAFLRITDTDLELRLDEEAGGEPVVSIYDGEDGSLLRQYPTEEMLVIARKITEQMLDFREALIHGGGVPAARGLFADTVV